TGIKNKQGKTAVNIYLLANNIFDIAYQEHLSRLKYFYSTDGAGNPIPAPNGRLGIFNMGRNISLKIIVPF
ncbi:hypothetical protein ABTA67_20100, partial [Acinetobacter baumannii]